MQKATWYKAAFFLALVSLALLSGCNLFNPNSNDTNETGSSISPAASLNLKFVVPNSNDKLAGSTAIRAQTTSTRVKIILTVVKTGYANAKPAILVKFATPDSSGNATVNFENIPVGAALAKIQIESGHIQGWTDFQGASDLAAGSNVMEVAPAGSRMEADLLAGALEDAIKNSTIMAAAGAQTVTNLRNALSSIDTQADNPYSKVLNLLITQLSPAGMIRVVADNTAKTLTGFNGTSQAWQKTYSAVWTGTDSILGISSANLTATRIVRQGFGNFSMVEWRDATTGYAILTTHKNTDGEGQMLFGHYGKFDQVLPISDTVFVAGAYSIKNSCPALYKWDTGKNAYPANSTSDPSNLEWQRIFTNHTYSSTPTTGSAISNIRIDDSKNMTVIVKLSDGTVRAYRVAISDGTATSLATTVTPNKPPTVAITAPANASSYAATETIAITTNAADADGSISQVQFFAGTAQIGTATASPWSINWSGMATGTYQLVARAWDNLGFSALSSPVQVTITGTAVAANQSPTVSITAPTSGATYTAGDSIAITATAIDSDGAISKVEFYNGSTLLETDTAAPYSYTWASVSAGSYSITAKAYDNKDATTTSTAISVTVNAPSVSLPDLVITEISSYQYSNNPRWIELKNTTNSALQLSDYSIKALQNDGTNLTNEVTFPLPAYSLAANSYVVVRYKTGDYQYTGPGLVHFATNGAGQVPYWGEYGYFNLIKNSDSSTMDFVKFGNVDQYSNTIPTIPSGQWSGNAATALPATLGYALARNMSEADNNTASNWTVRGFLTPGAFNDATSDTDADGDGIPDESEVSGKTYCGMPLYDWGARPGVKDIFVHIDYMDPTSSANALAHTPNKTGLDRIVAAFAKRGFAIHFDVGTLLGSGIANYNMDNRDHKVGYLAEVSMDPTSGVKTIYQYKVESLPIYKTPVFHYCLLSNKIHNTSASGLGELGGNDFIVAIGGSTLANSTDAEKNLWANNQGSTIMHELGHNLGLKHGGDEDTNYKPNYLSLMNYLYSNLGVSDPANTKAGDRYYHQMYAKDGFNSSSVWAKYFNGTGSSWEQLHNGPYTADFVFDFSSKTASDLNEGNLVESAGLGVSGGAAVDWNGDGDKIDSLSYNINPSGDSTLGNLHDYNDWQAINIKFMNQFSGAGSIRASVLTGTARPRKDYLCDEFQEVVECQMPPCGHKH